MPHRTDDVFVAEDRQSIRIATFYLILVAIGATGILLLHNPWWSDGVTWEATLEPSTSLRVHNVLMDRPLQWEPFSTAALHASLRRKRSVLVFFYADWDVTGLYLLKDVIDTPEFRRSVGSHRVTMLDANITGDRHANALRALNSRGAIPLLAVYGVSSPKNPIVLEGWFEVAELVAVLDDVHNS